MNNANLFQQKAHFIKQNAKIHYKITVKVFLQSGVQTLGASGQAERTFDLRLRQKPMRGRSKPRKTYFLKNITIFFVSLENSCNFAD